MTTVEDVGSIDHIGYLADDCEMAVNRLSEVLDLEVTRRFERPEFALFGAYLGHGPGSIEVFSYSDPDLLATRLAGARLRLDHVAFLVLDIGSAANAMRRRGVRFCGPDVKEDVFDPIELSGVKHLWTVPSSILDVSLQLVERRA